MKELFCNRDLYGVVQVYEEGGDRVLAFTEGDEQSRMSLADPVLLKHEYTQAMLLALLWCQPKRALMLGLGGGCLLRALHHAVPGINLTAVELRRMVINAAKQYFFLPQGKRIELINQEAGEYLALEAGKKVDLLFTDLYSDAGMDPNQLAEQFLLDCAGRLKSNGWLVINCWGNEQSHPELLDYLQQQFADVRHCNPGGGNWVVFASPTAQPMSQAQMRDRAKQLASSLGFSLARPLASLVELND